MAQHATFDAAFKAMYRRIASVQNTLPTVLANEGVNFFVGNFDKEGFVNVSIEKWKTPERKIPGTLAYKYPKKKDLGRRTRKTLVKTGKLKRQVNNSVVEKSIKRIVWKVVSPYGKRHNDGLDGMPKRQFMGESKTLNAIFAKKIIQAYKYAFK
jgi:hypothetical protein